MSKFTFYVSIVAVYLMMMMIRVGTFRIRLLRKSRPRLSSRLIASFKKKRARLLRLLIGLTSLLLLWWRRLRLLVCLRLLFRFGKAVHVGVLHKVTQPRRLDGQNVLARERLHQVERDGERLLLDAQAAQLDLDKARLARLVASISVREQMRDGPGEETRDE